MITGALLEPVVDPEEGPAPSPPPIFRPNCHEAQRTGKKFWGDCPPPLSNPLWHCSNDNNVT